SKNDMHLNIAPNRAVRRMKLYLLSLALSSCIATSLVAAPNMQAVIDKHQLPDLSETQSWQSKLIKIEGLMHATKDSSPYTGRYVSYRSTSVDEAKGENRIFITGSYTDGLKSGAWVTYDKRGNIHAVEHYERGERHGKQYQWWFKEGYGGPMPQDTEWGYIDGINGTLTFLGNHINGVKDGTQTRWHMNGEVWMLHDYKKDVSVGIWKEYAPDGTQYSETVFKDGKAVDRWYRNLPKERQEKIETEWNKVIKYTKNNEDVAQYVGGVIVSANQESYIAKNKSSLPDRYILFVTGDKFLYPIYPVVIVTRDGENIEFKLECISETSLNQNGNSNYLCSQ
ncbi:MAG: hypothetical protein OQK82_03165, partial [Candidatus Pacearchaeota archaeon]|nr:hypothetical protein [Candidatus Pacearchaeota archaeon]